ncbi:hypothetical protein V1505DRAFT_47943 [Lipomyces doorenjongii]
MKFENASSVPEVRIEHFAPEVLPDESTLDVIPKKLQANTSKRGNEAGDTTIIGGDRVACGMKRKIFWRIFILAVVIVGGGVGGAHSPPHGGGPSSSSSSVSTRKDTSMQYSSSSTVTSTRSTFSSTEEAPTKLSTLSSSRTPVPSKDTSIQYPSSSSSATSIRSTFSSTEEAPTKLSTLSSSLTSMIADSMTSSSSGTSSSLYALTPSKVPTAPTLSSSSLLAVATSIKDICIPKTNIIGNSNFLFEVCGDVMMWQSQSLVQYGFSDTFLDGTNAGFHFPASPSESTLLTQSPTIVANTPYTITITYGMQLRLTSSDLNSNNLAFSLSFTHGSNTLGTAPTISVGTFFSESNTTLPIADGYAIRMSYDFNFGDFVDYNFEIYMKSSAADIYILAVTIAQSDDDSCPTSGEYEVDLNFLQTAFNWTDSGCPVEPSN